MMKRLFPYAILFLCIQTGLRFSLLARAWLDVEWSPVDMLGLFARGFWLDIVTALFCLLPVALYGALASQHWQNSRAGRAMEAMLRFIFMFLLLFDAVAEHLFWTEFTTRFNFIAVDYLVYTNEVIGNIVESYPLFWLFSGIGLGALCITLLSFKYWPPAQIQKPLLPRLGAFIVMLLTCGAGYGLASYEQAQFSDNAEANELAANGIYNLFYAFWNNEISYDRFYASEDEARIASNARNLLWEEDSEFLYPDGKDLTRVVRMPGKERHKNVILVVMESMSADFMGIFGNKDGLTPNLDRLAQEGLFFSDTYATGTRTVRGLEAVTLSIPPTPGQSILRRPDNGDLFSLGFIFKDRGYDTTFFYGGYGYFDNMNTFFSGNGFGVVDRTEMSAAETHFANVWGICDEDMFARALREADSSYAAGKPFMQLIMTTSNHRPYTYPDGRIDIASHSGRLGGVKYADYSVGKLIEWAKEKPWFNDTVFVFVADHTAGAGGKAELDPHKYHIPMIFYAPGFIQPQRYEKVTSQIDLAPILLGQLNFSYYTKFYGEDLMHDEDEIPHAFISNYQKIGLIKDGSLFVLAPKRKVEGYSWPGMEAIAGDGNPLLSNAITYYQSASWWKQQYRRIPSVMGKDAGSDASHKEKRAGIVALQP